MYQPETKLGCMTEEASYPLLVFFIEEICMGNWYGGFSFFYYSYVGRIGILIA